MNIFLVSTHEDTFTKILNKAEHRKRMLSYFYIREAKSFSLRRFISSRLQKEEEQDENK